MVVENTSPSIKPDCTATASDCAVATPDCAIAMGCEFHTVLAEERKLLNKVEPAPLTHQERGQLSAEAAERRNKDERDAELTAFSISGGGIRSASFGLGVMQALVAGNVFKKIDYLSTSSGGGYIGSSLSYFLHQGLPDGSKAGTEKHNFPFGTIGAGRRASNQSNQASNSALDFLRQHSLYLTPSKGLDLVALVSLLVRTVAVSLLIHFSFFLTLLLTLSLTGLVDIGTEHRDWLHLTPKSFLHAAGLIVVAFGVLSTLASLATFVAGRHGSFLYMARVKLQGILGCLVKCAFVALLLGSLEPVYHLLKVTLDMNPLSWASGSTVLGAAMGFLKKKPDVEKKPGMFAVLIPLAASSLITYGLLIGAYALLQAAAKDHLILLLVCTGLLLLMGFIINTNYFGLHRMYRDRLMENFMPNVENVCQNRWGPATEADKILLQDVCDPAINPKPFHLINTNLVLSDSSVARYGARGGDSFVLSPLYCGGDACGYIPTKKWSVNGGSGMSLATAMSISGASVNPNSANNSRGITRNKLVSGLLTILSLRLGYWVSNPKRPDLLWRNPNFFTTGLFGFLFGTRLTENSRMLELTDGGHFDNVAFYELIRRKVKLIIVSDAGADPAFHFDDLGCTVERVRVDFGVKIRFNHNDYNLDNLQPGTSEADKIIVDKYGLAKNAFAVGTIEYPPDFEGEPAIEGVIIYVKATLVDGLPADIYTYKSSHAAFPHEPTGDQLYDEVQFEAYRELGYQLTWEMLNALGEYREAPDELCNAPGTPHKHWYPSKDRELKLLVTEDGDKK